MVKGLHLKSRNIKISFEKQNEKGMCKLKVFRHKIYFVYILRSLIYF